MDATESIVRIRSRRNSEDLSGDSDVDENPFEHSSVHGVEALSPDFSDAPPRSGGVIAEACPGQRFSSTATTNIIPPSSFSMGTLPQDQWRQFSQTPGPLAFPTIVGHSNPFITGGAFSHGEAPHRALVLDASVLSGAAATSAVMDDNEVETETETEGETENDDDEAAFPAYGVPAAGSAMAPATEWSTSEEKEWENRIDRQVRNAKAGQPDAHAMRHLLRKAGFVPSSLRKDVWRLLILGRIDVGAGEGMVNEVWVAQRDALALDGAILSTELNLDNQRVVRVDVERTRPALEQFKRPWVKNMLTRVLTYHCKTHGVRYKQGMHEVLAAFVALSDPELPTSDISLCYSAFIKRFLSYAFSKDEEFLSLQICFRLFRILLLYHHPRLCRFLDQYQLQPELYATPWFMTLFASSLDLPRLYEVWDFYLIWGDPALHQFVVLAFVMANAEVILKAEEANLPETMCRLSVGMNSVTEVRALVRTAKALMLNTPKSFRKILRSALSANLSQSQMNLVLNTLQVSSCIPVSAEEVISYILHKNPHRQLDQESDQEVTEVDEAKKAFVGNPGLGYSPSPPMSPPPARRGVDAADRSVRPASPQRVAERAAMRSLRVHRQYIIMDCRPKQEFEACRLAPALHLDPGLLESPDDLDAKLKEFNPLQGVAHFCLVGAGGDTGADWQRKNQATSDLSGQAMGLLPPSTSKGDLSTRVAASPGRRESFRNDREGDTGDKDGGFNWMGGFSKALAGRVQGGGGGREGEEVGREEDVQVARFVLMLLQYNFPYISHVRGDMAACLGELSTQALDEVDGEHFPNGDSHETLHGLLIGSEADRVRGELTRCSPEKKSEGFLAGLAKWTKDKGDWKGGDSASDVTAGTEGTEGRGRVPSWIGSWDSQGAGADRGDVGGKGKRVAELEAVKPLDHQALDTRVSTKRGLFGGVLNRFDKSPKAAARGNGRGGVGGRDTLEVIEIMESPLPRDGSSTRSDSLRWLKASNTATAAPSEAENKTDSRVVTVATNACSGAPDVSGSGAVGDNGAGEEKTATGTWVKQSKVGGSDRLARFLGKVLGVRDDALPEEAIPTGRDRDRTSDTVVANAEGTGAGLVTLAREESGGIQEECASRLAASGARSSGSNPAAAATSSAYEATTVTATAVYPTTTATVDAFPIAVAVAIPVADGNAARSDPARPARRPSRNRGARGAAGGLGATAGRREGEAAAAAGGGEAVLISQWVTKEEQESGGRVRVFSAQRVLEGKVQKKCRLAVSPRSMIQFDNIREGDGGTRGVISEHRVLRHLARITSRKRHADLLVFHFKSRSGAPAASSAPGSSSVGAGAASASSRRFRTRTTSESDSRQPDTLLYFLREHAECLRIVKENYRKVVHVSGRSGGGNGVSSDRPIATPTLGSTSRRRGSNTGQDSQPRASSDGQRPTRAGRNAARTAGAVAGATGLVVGATAGVAVGAAAGVAAGAAFFVGHRRGAEDRFKARSTSPSRHTPRGIVASNGGGGGASASASVNANAGRTRESGGWIPIDAPGGWIPINTQVEARRRAHVSGGGGGSSRPSAATGSARRSSFTRNQRNEDGASQGRSRSVRGGGAMGGPSKGRDMANGPTWLGRG